MIFKRFNYNKIFLSLVFILFLSVGFLFCNETEAASLYLTTANNKVTVGSLITVNLLVNTQGKTINNAEAVIRFPNDLVDVVSVKGSLFSLWVESPSFSNSSGTISFNGGIPDPGYNGGGTKILTIVARAKKAGTVSFLFGDAAVRENDGLGTDILSGQSPVSIVVENTTNNTAPTEVKNDQTKPATPTTPTNVSETESPVAISSPTYPNSNTWYSSDKGVVKWSLSSKATAVQTLIDNNQYSTPTIKYSPAIFSKNLSDLGDGTWYFHVRYLVNNTWSKTSHFKIQIDKTAPTNFDVLPDKNNNCITGLRLSATDSASGIDYYNISIDNQPNIKVLASDAVNIIPWPKPTVGTHHILTTVYDKAGNQSEFNNDIVVEKLETPVLDNTDSETFVDKKITISGKSIYINAPFKLIVNSEAGVYQAFDLISDESGKFSKEIEFASVGSYQVLVSALGCDDDNNSLAAQINVLVKPATSSPKQTNTSGTDYSILFNIIKVIIILVLLFGWYKYTVIKLRLWLTGKRAKRLTISALLGKAEKDLAVLEKARKKKSLTRNEEKSLVSLKKIISDIDDINNAKK